MKQIGVLNGPNLGRLGKREPDIYGENTLADLLSRINDHAAQLGCEVDCFQSNHEGELIDRLEKWADSDFVGAIINPAGFTHTSVALRDAIAGSGLLCVEVHLSNIHAREEFRKVSLTAPVCDSVISGFGFDGYLAALDYIKNKTARD